MIKTSNTILISQIISVMLLSLSFGIVSNTHAENDTETTLVFTGDIFLGNWAVDFLEKHGTDYPFGGTQEILTSANLVIGNLESALIESGEKFVDKTYVLKSPPTVAKALKQANIGAVTLANNHILDFGIESLQETMKNLDEAGVHHFGAGISKEDALMPYIYEHENLSFAFHGFSATFPEEFWASDSTGGTAFPFDEDLRTAIAQSVANHDVVIAVFHWGAEKRETPKDYQVDLAHLCIDLGVDLVVGHHPHVAQSIEMYNGVPILYSLGNYTFASYSETAKVGLLARAEFQNDSLTAVEVIPINVYNAELNFRPVPLENDLREEFIVYLNNISAPYNGERYILDGSRMVKLGNQ
ncbi:CapA family protein [bacterium]|nr:CapA family protein [bacterium]